MRSCRPIAALVLFAVAAIWVVDPASARTMKQKFDEACAADIERLCPEALPSDDAVKTCLLTRRARVDRDCLRFVDAGE